LFQALEASSVQPKKILEPSFGTGEFIMDAKLRYPSADIIGVEKNVELYDSLALPQGTTPTEGTYYCSDFLTVPPTLKADLIIGNPPYFVMESNKITKAEAARRAACMNGRPNIYIMFIYKCLEDHLTPGGHLAFIVPTSLYNCSYYQPMRDYIQKNTTIVHLENLMKPGFHETGQETMLIVLRKEKLNDDYIFRGPNGNIYISPFYKELATSIEGATTLEALGLGVKTGNVVWNELKEKEGKKVKGTLSDEPGTLLIYSSNINNCELKINNLGGKERKQYVKDMDKQTLSGPVILVERGYGNSFSFNCALINEKDFYAENHLNVVYAKDVAASEASAQANLDRVMRSFRSEKTKQFVKWFVGNGTVSAKDLESLFPIF
jgi:type I restriction-modification system DNA methylase subunit